MQESGWHGSEEGPLGHQRGLGFLWCGLPSLGLPHPPLHVGEFTKTQPSVPTLPCVITMAEQLHGGPHPVASFLLLVCHTSLSAALIQQD
jgi:hypothetical protein